MFEIVFVGQCEVFVCRVGQCEVFVCRDLVHFFFLFCFPLVCRTV